MPWYQIFQDGPEYEARRKKTTFDPPNVTIKEVHDAVPNQLFERSTGKSLYYIARHIAVTYGLYYCGQQLDALSFGKVGAPLLHRFIRLLLWLFYWGWQGMSFAGIWALGHEAGHDALSPSALVNSVLGIVLHSFVLTPYFAWRATHRAHHKATNHLDRDETYIPPTRKDLKLPDGRVAVRMDYVQALEDTPAYILFKLFVRQFFGFQLYLIHNRKGNPRYPRWTSHYNPSAKLFRPNERRSIILSNIAIGTMIYIISLWIKSTGWSYVWKHYFGPWLMAHNWIVTFTYLQHSDPTIPYYRKNQWTFARGALATVDRPIFGWAGRFFLHNISTDHLAHHFFVSVPFYNLPAVTEAIKPVLGQYYNYDSTPVIPALWRSFTSCVFIEDEGDIVFFKNKYGEALIQPRIPTEVSAM
ncbi:hypothetical protein AMATHDRAFT_54590 [Amanita thiersii Skay4041]|uniref:Fatty acid desaturase domain-containing protein n=1 Tax=Amanita thiersii Skay4041 TaxID=703135 RepID=A0A2A9NSH6_9AGAR|nr:hypothetical protein AMATHDRAFT_54590 [Amanita thiersii Skay4041]